MDLGIAIHYLVMINQSIVMNVQKCQVRQAVCPHRCPHIAVQFSPRNTLALLLYSRDVTGIHVVQAICTIANMLGKLLLSQSIIALPGDDRLFRWHCHVHVLTCTLPVLELHLQKFR